MRIFILVLFIFMVGCSKSALIHPTKPKPINTYDSNFFIDNGNVCMSTDEFLEFRLWLEDIKRYTTDMNDILDYYQK